MGWWRDASAEQLVVGAGPLENGDGGAGAPDEQPVPGVGDMALVAAKPAALQCVHAVSAAERVQRGLRQRRWLRQRERLRRPQRQQRRASCSLAEVVAWKRCPSTETGGTYGSDEVPRMRQRRFQLC